MMLNGLDICAGSGIGSLAFESIGLARTVCYVERDAYCQRLLQQRMLDGWLSPAPIWDDLKTFDGRPWRGLVDLVFGGIPCQPHSLAGKRGGKADERDLWPDFWRVVCKVGPSVVLVENVPGLLSSDGGQFMGRILGDLAEGGYDAEWGVLSARGVGAPHRRERVWLVAYAGGTGRQQDTGSAYGNESPHEGGTTPDVHKPASDGERLREGYVAYAQGVLGAPLLGVQQDGVLPPHVADAVRGGCRGGQDDQGQQATQRGRAGEDCQAMADTKSILCQRPIAERDSQRQSEAKTGDRSDAAKNAAGAGGWWDSEPDVGRVADGVAARVDRLRTIGNGWVPQVAAVIGLRIMSTLGMPKAVVSK